jgi:hypothetical protein
MLDDTVSVRPWHGVVSNADAISCGHGFSLVAWRSRRRRGRRRLEIKRTYAALPTTNVAGCHCLRSQTPPGDATFVVGLPSSQPRGDANT